MKCAYLTPDLRPAIPRFRFPATQKVLSVGGCTLVGIHDRREHSMCWKCDNPQATVDDYLENLWQTIKDHRWAPASTMAPPAVPRPAATDWAAVRRGRPWRLAKSELPICEVNLSA